MILDGEVDYLPEQAFLNVGTIEEAIEKGKKLLEQAKKYGNKIGITDITIKKSDILNTWI